MASPVLWQNKERNVTVFDIPRSIAAAQGNSPDDFTDSLRSSEPLDTPHASTEPKSEKAKASLRGNTVNETLHAEYRHVLQQALEDARAHHAGIWCRPRPFVDAPQNCRSSKKRKFKDEDGEEWNHDTARATVERCFPDLPPEFLANIANLRKGDLISQLHAEAGSCAQIVNHQHGERTFKWTSSSAADLEISYNNDRYNFRIPPGSTAFLGDCSETLIFHSHVRQQAQDQDTRRHFDFILLDPPWPNRSVKRTHKRPGTTYHTLSSLDDVYNSLLGMDLDILMADGCLVGIWITNKPAIRDLVLSEEYGIFASWGLTLEEEWLWLKTTTSGEPVTPVDSVWRKPYEVLLLGRRVSRASLCKSTMAAASPELDNLVDDNVARTKRRVVISVPDLHSRKPCLKELIEPLLGYRNDYRALEIFARHLVAGWWSWGNECLKFNWNGYWQKDVYKEEP